MHLIIALLGSLAMGVYWDAAKNKVGKVPGEDGPHNLSAARWALLSALGVPGVIYFMNRKELLARAVEHPVEADHVRRNLAIILCSMGFLVFASSLGGASGNVALVKGGVLEADKTTTVGEALDKYSFFRSCKWESDKTENGAEFVNAIGELDIKKLSLADRIREAGVTGLRAMFQFTINRDGKTFEYNAFTLQAISKDGSTKDLKEMLASSPAAAQAYALIASIPDGSAALERVYGNKPLL